MGIFDIFKRQDKNKNFPEEYKSALNFNEKFEALLSADKYIARSDYKHLIEQYSSTYTFFESMQRGKILSVYCKQNKLQENELKKFIACYSDIIDLVKGSEIFCDHNNSYILTHLDSEKKYLDKVLYEVDPKIQLDIEQRTAILSDEDYTLIIAGAGAGKTTTVAAKVRYLVEKKHIDPKQILVISFTNKAVGELQERINTQLSIPCPITTFHKAGYAILRKQDDEKKTIVSEGFLYKTVNNYLKGNILEQPELVDKLIMFFGSYFDAPYEGNDINLFFNYISKADLRQRFDLTKELSKTCNAKIIAVGDDWQSIYAFSGSDITLFTHFCEIMGYGQELKITKTYRNAQEIIDIAGNFIQKNDTQIKKKLIANDHIQKPVIIYSYNEQYDRKQFQGKGGKYYHLGKKVEEIIGQILEQNSLEGKRKNASILLIGRFNFDARNLCYSQDFVYNEENNKIFSKKYPKAKLEFLTAHSSKGLGFDNVIIINARNEVFGFPSKIDDDPVMKYVTKDDTSIEYAEERRLFYVAMTRTKNRVYIVTPEQHPSEFILELIKDYPNVLVLGNLIKDNSVNMSLMKKCPICSYPLQLRYKKNYGLKLWLCSNEPEVCNYLTNEIAGGEFAIQKCDSCKDGYLIVKKTSSGGYMLGCSNYKADGTGCNRTMVLDYYKKWLSTDFEDDLSIDKPAYIKEIKVVMPQVQAVQISTPPVERKKAEVHTTQKSEHFIEQDGFQIVVDDDGQFITDMELLAELRVLRAQIMKEDNRSAYTIIGNKGLVSLATYRPETKEEFVSLYGLGETTYQAYGDRFIKAIKDFYKK